MFRSDVVFQLDRGGVLPLLKPPQSVRLALLGRDHDFSRGAMWLDWDRPASRTTTQPTGRRQSTRIIAVSRNGWFCYASPFFFPFLLTLCRLHSATRDLQRPICCMKDHTVPVSNQTTLAGARPLLVGHTHPHTPTHIQYTHTPFSHGWGQEGRASSTRQRRHSGSSLVGRPLLLTRTLVAVLVATTTDRAGWCGVVWCYDAHGSQLRMLNVIRQSRPAPHGPCPSSGLGFVSCCSIHTVKTPVLRLMRRRPLIIDGALEFVSR